MNIRIEKCDNNDELVLTFLAKESLKLYLELNPQFKAFYEGEFKDLAEAAAIKEYLTLELNKVSALYVAFLDDEMVGAIQLNNDGYLSSLFVNEKYQNQGIGTKLLEHLIAECNNFDVIRVDARVTAISLYERFSFHRVIGKENKAFVPMERERGHYGK